LRGVVASLLVAFALVVFLSFGKKEEEPVRIHVSQPSGAPGDKVVDLSDNFLITGTKGDSESFRMQADQVTGFVGTRRLSGECGWRWWGQRREAPADRKRGQFDMADKRAQLAGDVQVAGKNGFRLTTSSLYFDGERT